MQRRTIGILVALVGVTFLITVLGNNLFRAASSWETLSDDVRPSYTNAAITQLRTDAQGLRALTDEFSQNVLPTMAQALGITEPELATRFLGDFPATATGVFALPQVADGLEARADLLASQQQNFRSADAIPTQGQSSVAVPWFILVMGVLAIGVGIALMFTSRVAIAAAAAAALGAVMLVVPLATSLPSKAADADRLSEATAPLFTPAAIQESRASIETLSAMASELSSNLVPALAAQLGVSAQEAQAFVQTNFPLITAALGEFPTTLQRFGASTDVIEANVERHGDVREVPNRTVAWIVVSGGIATLVLAGLALTTGARGIATREERRLRRERRAA